MGVADLFAKKDRAKVDAEKEQKTRDDLLAEIRILSVKLGKMESRYEQANEELGLSDEVMRLKRSITILEIDRDKKQEEFDRREREVEHKVGLEKLRSKQEVELAKREAILEAREEALNAAKDRFEQQMDFIQKQMGGELDRLNKLTTEILTRLPTVKVDKHIKETIGVGNGNGNGESHSDED